MTNIRAKKANDICGKPVILIVDDIYMALRPLTRLISSEKYRTIWVSDENQGLKLLKKYHAMPLVCIIDLKSSTMGAGGFFHQARSLCGHIPLLITSPLGTFLHMRGDFYEFSGSNFKDEINDILSIIVRRLANQGKSKIRASKRAAKTHSPTEYMVGCSPSINEIHSLIDKVSHFSSTVLIQGESGTGKELIAQAVHHASHRKNRPFVAINCGAIPANLMESELFGHERGAFTSANTHRKGKFEIAQGGTVFLDEVSEIERDLQVKLLRVLQEREFERVGGNETHKIDVRIIAATSRDLREAVEAGSFREDLFFRLNVIPFQVPPLRERRMDIPLLLNHFMKITAEKTNLRPPQLTDQAEKALLWYSYPGNVRELANVVERLFVLCSDGQVALADLPAEILKELKETSGHSEDPKKWINDLPETGVRLREMEKALIIKTLEKTSGNKAAAARMLGITRRRLYIRITEYGISSA